MRGDVDGGLSLASPPSIYKNVVITGGNNGKRSPSFGLYGDIRGGREDRRPALVVPHRAARGRARRRDGGRESWKNRSGTNTWSFFTIDTERGIVYASLGAPTSDYYGGDRKGANLYGNSVVALDAMTGKLKWYRQLVHHGHAAETWDNRDVAQMYSEAIRWALGLTDGDATPRPMPKP